MSVFLELSTLLSFYVLLFGELRFIFSLRLFLFLPSPLLFKSGASQRYDTCSVVVFILMAGARNEMLYIALCRRLGNQCIGSSLGPSCSFFTHFFSFHLGYRNRGWFRGGALGWGIWSQELLQYTCIPWSFCLLPYKSWRIVQ